MVRRRYEDGEYMDLVWDGTPDAFYIRGHVSNADGLEILHDAEVVDDLSVLGKGIQKYGRWSTETNDMDCEHVLREYLEPGRGRFKMTVFGVGIFAEGN